jgi:hypothetical protein
MPSFRKRYLPWVAPLVVAVFSGCSAGGPTIVPVSGILTYKGKPVTNAIVFFEPENGQRPSTGDTDEEGRFTLVYDAQHDGAVLGKHRVWAKMRPTRPTTRAQQEAAIRGKKPPTSPDMAAFFDKYGQKNSKIEVAIDKNTKELNLNWD